MKAKYLKNYYTIIFTLFLLSIQMGCSSTPKTVALGTVIGGSVGGAIGSQNGNSGSGAAIGALLGAGISYMILKSNQKKSNGVTLPGAEKMELDDADSPFLKTPKIRKYWQPDKIEGRKFLKGHWVYEIEEQSVWMQ